jgi:hypothetical protein
LTSNESGFLKNNNNRGVVIGEGINSLPEGYNLYVSEGILTEQVKVALKNTEDWADHVFSKTSINAITKSRRLYQKTPTSTEYPFSSRNGHFWQ